MRHAEADLHRSLQSRGSLRAALIREAPCLGVVAVYTVVLAVALPQMLVQDSWLAFVSGRELAVHGLPHADALTVWTHGAPWIDQQWLGQLTLYGLVRLGGVRLTLVVHALLLVLALSAAGRAARRPGPSL